MKIRNILIWGTIFILIFSCGFKGPLYLQQDSQIKNIDESKIK